MSDRNRSRESMAEWRKEQAAKKAESAADAALRMQRQYWKTLGPEALDKHLKHLQGLRQAMPGGDAASSTTTASTAADAAPTTSPASTAGQSADQRQLEPTAREKAAERKRQQRQRDKEAKEAKAQQGGRGGRGRGVTEQPSPNPFAGTHADPAQALRRATKRVKDRCSKLPTSHPSLHYSPPSFCLSL